MKTINCLKELTKKTICDILKILCIIFVISLKFTYETRSSVSQNFNEKLFLEEVRTLHLRDQNIAKQYNLITNTRKEIDNYIEYDHSIFEEYINKICDNKVGNEMMKIMLARIKVYNKNIIKIKASNNGCYAHVENCGESAVYIDFGDYDKLTGKTTKPLCGIDQNGNLVEKFNTIWESIFHELCHIFHVYSGTVKLFDNQTIYFIYGTSPVISLWTERSSPIDEEIYNITGYYYENCNEYFDPICCNMFDIYSYCSTPNSIIQRVFHCDWEDLWKQIGKLKRKGTIKYKINRFIIDITNYIHM